jgi:hypothetical protein
MVHRPWSRRVSDKAQSITILAGRFPRSSKLPCQDAPHLALDEDWLTNGPNPRGQKSQASKPRIPDLWVPKIYATRRYS